MNAKLALVALNNYYSGAYNYQEALIIQYPVMSVNRHSSNSSAYGEISEQGASIKNHPSPNIEAL